VPVWQPASKIGWNNCRFWRSSDYFGSVTHFCLLKYLYIYFFIFKITWNVKKLIKCESKCHKTPEIKQWQI
jgi:hypothetical protein